MSGWGSTHTVQRQYDRPLQESRTEMLKKKRRPSSAPPRRRRRKNDRKIARQRPVGASRAQQQRRPSRAKKPSDNQMWNDRTTILEFEKRAQKQKRPSSAKLSAASASKYLLKQKINLGSPRSMNRCRHGLRVQHSSESPFTSMQHRSAALGLHQRMRTPSASCGLYHLIHLNRRLRQQRCDQRVRGSQNVRSSGAMSLKLWQLLPKTNCVLRD